MDGPAEAAQKPAEPLGDLSVVLLAAFEYGENKSVLIFHSDPQGRSGMTFALPDSFSNYHEN
jgi:hypothetical protein